jgi:hypothetical protein
MVEISVSIQVGLNCKYGEVLSTCEGFFFKEENRNVSRQTDRQAALDHEEVLVVFIRII